jgi:hypothetical protein
MKRSGRITLSALMWVFLAAATAFAAGPEDPYYKQWSSFKAGSSVTLVGRAEEKTGVEAFTQTITLKELGNDYVVVEIARKEEKSGSLVKSKKVGRFLGNTDTVKYRGQEEIDVAGKKLACQRYTDTYMDDSGKEMMTFDYWFHPDIPGAARIASQSSYGANLGIGTSTVTQTAVSWEKR